MTKAPPSAKSLATRQRITEAAQKLFGEVGYQRTTVRAVADRAAINPALVIRYFGSKEGLFAATARFDLKLPDLTQVSKRKRGSFLARHLLERWDGPEAGDALPALLAVAITHPDGRRRLAKILKDQLEPAVAAVVAPHAAGGCAALIATQAIGLAFTRYVLKLPPVVDLSHEEIVTFIGSTFQRYLEIDS